MPHTMTLQLGTRHRSEGMATSIRCGQNAPSRPTTPFLWRGPHESNLPHSESRTLRFSHRWVCLRQIFRPSRWIGINRITKVSLLGVSRVPGRRNHRGTDGCYTNSERAGTNCERHRSFLSLCIMPAPPFERGAVARGTADLSALRRLRLGDGRE